MIKIASTQFSLQKVNRVEDFWMRFLQIVDESQKNGAQAIVFPEYFSLGLMMAQRSNETLPFNHALHNSQNHSEYVLKEAQKIARDKRISLVLGTLPWLENGKRLNRSFMINESGKVLFQDKIFMTRFEDEVWMIQSGVSLVNTFDWQGLRCAILTCYDSEFAVLSQTLARGGVQLLFVPSCTDTEHGYWRVRHCCEARAIENQMFVVMASIVGGDKDFSEIDGHYGRAAVFSPCDAGFAANGVVCEGQTNQEGLCVASLNVKALQKIRQSGAVLNLRDALRTPSVEFEDIQFT